MSDEIFNILVLSDFHYKHDDKYKFEAVFNPFLECLKNLLEEQNGWVPHCVALIGDIVCCDGVKSLYDYAYMAEKMHDVRRVLGGKVPIIAVPGNHDKDVSSKLGAFSAGMFTDSFFEAYFGAPKTAPPQKGSIISLLKKCFWRCGLSTIENSSIVINSLNNCFGKYAFFAARYHTGKNWHPVPELTWTCKKKLKSISGYYLLEEPKICVIVLNTEWRYGGADKSSMTIGKRIVEKMAPIVEDYKDKGYFIITLMHRDPGSLQWEDRYSEDQNKPSPMERMIRVSDLIICAHDHVVGEVPPDILMDSAILYRNGCMFTNNKESAGHYPFFASLLKIDKKNRLLLSRKIRCESAECGEITWGESSIKTYCWQHIETPVIAPAKRINRLYKEIWMQYPLDNQILEEKILSLYFDKEQIPSFMHVVCCLLDKAPKRFWQEAKRVKGKTLVFLLYERIDLANDSWKEEISGLINGYKKIRDDLQDQAKENGLEVVFNLVLCKMLW